jgi:7tm Odorant receptor
MCIEHHGGLAFNVNSRIAFRLWNSNNCKLIYYLKFQLPLIYYFIHLKGSIKMLMVIAYKKELTKLFIDAKELCQTVSATGRLSRRYKIFDQYLNFCKLLYKGYHALGIVCCLIVCAYPGIMYLLSKKLVFAFSCYIPFMDPFSSIGYTITMIFHCICLFIVDNATVGMDTIFFFGVILCAIEVEIFKVQIDEFNELLTTNKDGDQNDKVRRSLNSIIKAHRSVNNDIARLGLIFFWPIAIQVGLSVVSLAISLFMSITVIFHHIYKWGYFSYTIHICFRVTKTTKLKLFKI